MLSNFKNFRTGFGGLVLLHFGLWHRSPPWRGSPEGKRWVVRGGVRLNDGVNTAKIVGF